MAEASEEAAFVTSLLAILTNPNPTGITPDDPYGQADDGIDRYDGFGREVLVEDLQVVRGECGAELEVTFGLALPPDDAWRTVPDRGVARVLFDRTWRELSGYGTPADYAPYVARQTERAARLHVERHRGGTASKSRETTRRSLPARDVQWQMLLDGLTVEGGPSIEVSPGRLEVRIADNDDHVDASSPVVTVIVTPDQWEDVLARHAWAGDVEMYLAEVLGPRYPDERFLVFYRGDLVRSIREELPPVHGAART